MGLSVLIILGCMSCELPFCSAKHLFLAATFVSIDLGAVPAVKVAHGSIASVVSQGSRLESRTIKADFKFAGVAGRYIN